MPEHINCGVWSECCRGCQLRAGERSRHLGCELVQVQHGPHRVPRVGGHAISRRGHPGAQCPDTVPDRGGRHAGAATSQKTALSLLWEAVAAKTVDVSGRAVGRLRKDAVLGFLYPDYRKQFDVRFDQRMARTARPGSIGCKRCTSAPRHPPADDGGDAAVRHQPGPRNRMHLPLPSCLLSNRVCLPRRQAAIGPQRRLGPLVGQTALLLQHGLRGSFLNPSALPGSGQSVNAASFP